MPKREFRVFLSGLTQTGCAAIFKTVKELRKLKGKSQILSISDVGINQPIFALH